MPAHPFAYAESRLPVSPKRAAAKERNPPIPRFVSQVSVLHAVWISNFAAALSSVKLLFDFYFFGTETAGVGFAFVGFIGFHGKNIGLAGFQLSFRVAGAFCRL